LKWIKKKPVYKYDEYDDILTKLAAINGIEDIHKFLHPSFDDLHDPYTLDNIEIARNKILNAIHNHKFISIYADIDCDGITAASIMYNYLRNFTDKVAYFHSQRSQGHSIDVGYELIPPETELLIIVDSSTSSDKTCRMISEKGIDIIIIDHHEPENKNPYALIINPQLDNYKNKNISGAGLAFKMIQVLDDTLASDTYMDFIDLAGIGLYGDAMSMREPENRYIVDQALKSITNPGIRALLTVTNKNMLNLTSTDLAYSIVPMLNGASRMDKIELALELLTCDDLDRCMELAKEIQKLNEERKKEQKQWIEKLSSQINEDDKAIVLIDDDIGKGFTGLISGDIASKYQRPVITMSRNGDKYHGSFRSYGDFNLKEFLATVPYATFAAGHSLAGGVGCNTKDLEAFKKYINDALKDYTFEQSIEYDLDLDAEEITEDLIEQVLQFNRITGVGMPSARFKVSNLMVHDTKMVGSKKKETANIICDDLILVKFKTTEEFLNNFSVFDAIEVVGTLNLFKPYRGSVRKQILIEDIKKVG
jgi:single-stranded-DNA-specific exonuclease